MRYLALACDYDGTLATAGRVDDETVAALVRLRESGRQLILVTGRELAHLLQDFPHVQLFDCVVVENGALLYWPGSRTEQLLAERPSEAFVAALRAAGVAPLSVGRVILATRTANARAVLDVIGELGLEHQLIFNKEWVMVLPAGVDKAAGLSVALRELRTSPCAVVAVGDAENDQALLALCGCGVAVANALPSLKEQADLVTHGACGAGVRELIDRMLATDLGEIVAARSPDKH